MMSVGGYLSTAGGVQYTGGIPCSTLGGYHDECGGCHEYTGGCSIHWGFHTNSIVFPMTFPSFIMVSPGCIHDILPVY